MKFKIVQTESQNGDHFSLALNSIIPIHNFFTHSIKGHLKNKESIIWENHKIKISTLAEPQTLIKDGGESLIQLGADIPFTSENVKDDKTTIKWRFAGLKIKLKLQKYGEHFELQYETELTGPIEQSISGTRGAAQVFLKPGRPLQLFEIGFQTKNWSKKRRSIFQKYPHIGKTFHLGIQTKQF